MKLFPVIPLGAKYRSIKNANLRSFGKNVITVNMGIATMIAEKILVVAVILDPM